MLLIIDASGSMGLIRKTVIEQLNKTLQVFRDAQEIHTKSQTIFVSLVFFNSKFIKTIMNLVPAAEIRMLNNDEYLPESFSPLFDAMGSSLSKLRHQLDRKKTNRVVVTIISDGYENGSTEYTRKMIANLVRELKSIGWIFLHIGANKQLKFVADALPIDNLIGFNADSLSVTHIMTLHRLSCVRFFEKVSKKPIDDNIDLQKGLFDSE